MKRVTGRELMDDPVESLAELEASLRDIERANRWLGGAAPVRSAIFSLQPRTVLDVGCGSADIALALVKDARRAGRELAVTCLDISDQMLQIAQARTRNDPALSFVRGNGAQLSFEDGAFDVVMCNLALHHFNPQEAVSLLAEMRRVSRMTPLLCDLRRSRVGHLGAWLFSRLTTTNRLTRHDAPLSVLRAYTPHEALRLAEYADWRNPQVRTAPFYRMVIQDA